MKTAPLLLACSSLLLIALAPAGKSDTYYIDADGGDDSNSGLSEEEAWKSLEKVNGREFQPGDRILFHAGRVWQGKLSPRGSGAEGNPITIHTYGRGGAPVIDGRGEVDAVVRLYNQEYWEINNLEIRNRSKTSTNRRGVFIAAKDYGTIHGVILRRLHIHDVGFSDDKRYGGIITEITGNDKKTKFHDLLIEECRIKNVDCTGISMHSSWKDRHRNSWHPSTGVVIRGNFIEETGKNGLVVRVCDGALIERNHFNRCCINGSGNALYPFNCDNTIIQHNEVCFTKYNPGDDDAGGFDSDWMCNGTTIQYNYSHDNEYGFMLVCCKGGNNHFNNGTVIRYNISQNDHGCTFRLSGPVRDVKIYNNVLYIGEKTRTPAEKKLPFMIIYHKSWDGWPEDVLYSNNIFFNMNRTAEYRLGKSKNVVFENNLFYGQRPHNEPHDPKKMTENPDLVYPGSAGMGPDTLHGYKSRYRSPCIDAGKEVEDNGGKDFWGNPLTAGRTDVGAYEAPR